MERKKGEKEGKRIKYASFLPRRCETASYGSKVSLLEATAKRVQPRLASVFRARIDISDDAYAKLNKQGSWILGSLGYNWLPSIRKMAMRMK